MDIQKLANHGIIVKGNYGFFWGGICSNWYKSPFTIDDITFNTVEQHMMYNKAMVFKDYEVAKKILATKDPQEQKALGRSVKNYTDEVWGLVDVDIVFEGCFEKFVQNKDLLEILLLTDTLELVEASPYDPKWGIAMAVNNPLITDKSKWKGKNLLGKILTNVRDTLKNE